jgi:sulfoxide reductase heme-binding subunit YedZ
MSAPAVVSPAQPSRLARRLRRHHLPLAALVAIGLLLVRAAVPAKDEWFRWSMATAYVGLVLLAASLLLGPLNVVRRRPNPVSTDLRRDLGIWAGLLSLAHFLVGWQVHMQHRYMYWLKEVKATGALAIRTDVFGWANHLGLLAVLIALGLVSLSNDVSLRALGTPRWKSLQRWNYALFLLVAAHGVAYQAMEKRKLGFMVVGAVICAVTLAFQLAGFLRVRAARRSEPPPRA